MTEWLRVDPPLRRRLANWIVAHRRSWRVTIRHDQECFWLDSDDYPIAAATPTLVGAVQLIEDLSAWELWGRPIITIDHDAALADAQRTARYD